MNTTDLALTLTVRDGDHDQDVAAVLDGVAVPYDTPTTIGPGVREQFAPGSFDIGDVIGKPLAWRHGEPIGRITHARNSDHGLEVTAEVANTALGRDAATLLRTGSVKGLSVGFEPVTNGRAKDLITRVKATLHELSLTHMPAYATAGVGAVREEETMPETTEVETAPVVPTIDTTTFARADQVEQLQRQIATLSERPVERRDKTMNEYLIDYGVARYQKRALDDLVLDATASDIPAIPSGLSAVIEFARPTVTAIGVSALPGTGNDVVWMTESTAPTVGKRSTAEKTAVPTGKPVATAITAPIETFAGALDVSFEFMARAAAYQYADVLRSMAEQYARKVNLDVAVKVTAAAANTIILPDTGLTDAVLGEKLGWAAGKVAAGTGRAPSIMVLSAAKFFQVAAIAGQGYPIAGGVVGNANLSSLTFTAFGVRFVCDPTLDTGLAADQHGYLLDPTSVGIKENPGAPMQISATNVELLGQDVALYGFVASAVLNADGIVSVTAA